MQIEESELKELLDKKDKSVENRRFPIEAILGLLGFLLSAFMANIFSMSLWLKILVWAFSLCYAVYAFYLLSRFFKSQYSTKDFIRELKDSKRIRKFSLLVLKDSSGTFKDSFLLRYDRRWKCFLLPYRQTHDSDDEKFILDYAENTLLLKNAEISSVKADDIEKFSVSDRMTKSYHHTFYLINFDAAGTFSDISDFKNRRKRKCNRRTFLINQEKFKWFTIDEMKRNKSIESKNSETVDFLARNF